MRNTMKPRNWLFTFGIFVLILLLLFAGVMYTVDPFFQFRYRDKTYAYDPRFANSGLIKNYDYDFLIVGSSMTQNFHMDLFRETMNVKPLHVNLGGMTPVELTELINLSARTGKAKQIITNASLGAFNNEDGASKNPQYLLGSDFLSVCRYLFSYEAWFRYLPANLRIAILRMGNPDLNDSLNRSLDVDYLGNWENSAVFGKKQALSAYKSSKKQAGEDTSAESYMEIIRGIDAFFASLDPGDAELSFFFPPYSALYWFKLGSKRDAYLDARDYFIEQATQRGYTVYDFQGEDYIRDLDKYMDVTHYSGEINDEMTLCFANGENIATPENMGAYREKLLAQLEGFREKYAEEL